MPSSHNVQYFRDELLAWFDVFKRDLPWRRSKDPYRVWVSEIMLQQTRVDTVIPYYERFMDKFPTLEALADAPEDEVLKAWEGLGYYSRARNLQTAVREVSELFGGVVPNDPHQISGLRGVGPYTAGAILSIAYNRPEPAVDGNVMRVLSRYFLIEDDIAKPFTRIKMERLIREVIPEDRAGDFNQALMELGALVCTPRSPHCLTCPVMEHCEGRLAGMELELPVKKKAKPPRPEYRDVALIEGVGDNRGKVLIRKRPDQGLLAGMWELPHGLREQLSKSGEASIERGARKAPAAKILRDETLTDTLWLTDLEQDAGLGIVPLEAILDIDHVFSHIHWHMRVYRCQAGEAITLMSPEHLDQPTPYAWIGPEDRDQYTFPNVFIRILETYWST